ncbi:DNA-binding response regulator [Paenibacillus sp. 598K]|uniref:response regulator transcription factor n=1 Tax=Paenibacillus sp. 598K TaxID=1117987 RepID=UPI000FFA28E1|nr:response regulator transcription factor [Paenibacillus sp. 598K]GBF76484.1 DNA-binding response regulator [Paenibacillus sp. 598K]
MIRILIVEDEQPISDLIRLNLSDAGYFCDCAFDGGEAIRLLEQRPYHLVLLDVMLPAFDGYDIMEYVKPLLIPVIFVTAKSQVEDRVKGLRLGADDYLTKPFEIIELLARVEAVLRRYNLGQWIFTIGDVTLDLQARTVQKNEENVALTKKEFELLTLFVQNKNIALVRDKIYEKVWGEEERGDSRTVDLHVQRLRKKLGWEHRIAAVYKVGYRLELES